MTLVIVAAGRILRMIANPVLPSGYPYVAFFPAVIVTSFLFGARLGTVAAEGWPQVTVQGDGHGLPPGFELEQNTRQVGGANSKI